MIDIIVVDDEELVRFGLRTILESDPELRVVAEARDGAEGLELCRLHRPAIVLMDIRMAGMDGLTATRELTADPAAPKVIVLTTFDVDDYVYQALESGAVGFLLKDTPPERLIGAVKTVAQGNAILSPGATLQLIRRFTGSPERRVFPGRSRLDDLTDRERGVLLLLAEGLSNAEIGARLLMSESTVKVHVSHVLAKLGAGNRVQAAILAHESGLVCDERMARGRRDGAGQGPRGADR
ncbi:response regulator transcription factor [Actinocorallia longicatena]|uniref:Response regulator transcription factor n=1 Tax=Actinocorallia longicatena TaxID=111803 RepID=A0ABP6QH71_9ACTN